MTETFLNINGHRINLPTTTCFLETLLPLKTLPLVVAAPQIHGAVKNATTQTSQNETQVILSVARTGQDLTTPAFQLVESFPGKEDLIETLVGNTETSSKGRNLFFYNRWAKVGDRENPYPLQASFNSGDTFTVTPNGITQIGIQGNWLRQERLLDTLSMETPSPVRPKQTLIDLLRHPIFIDRTVISLASLLTMHMLHRDYTDSLPKELMVSSIVIEPVGKSELLQAGPRNISLSYVNGFMSLTGVITADSRIV